MLLLALAPAVALNLVTVLYTVRHEATLRRLQRFADRSSADRAAP